MNKKKLILALSLSLAILSSLYLGVASATVPSAWGHPWDTDLLDPLTYYVYDSWSEISSAESDWDNLGTDFGQLTQTLDDSGPLVLDCYNSNDGFAAWVSCYPTSGDVTTMSLCMNDYYLTHGSTSVGLPLNTANKRKSVIAHELGHVMNLAHVSSGSIMVTTGNGRLTSQIWSPTDDDETGVNNIW